MEPIVANHNLAVQSDILIILHLPFVKLDNVAELARFPLV
jgi:hypothetical protein